MYLHPVVPRVEEARASDVGQDGVQAVLQHVVSGDWRQAMSLGIEGAIETQPLGFQFEE